MFLIRTENYRSGVMTSTRNQPLCGEHRINIGCFDRTRINPRNFTERIIAIKIHKNPSCLNWKSNGICLNKATEELYQNFKVVDNGISDKYVKSFTIYEYEPKRVQSPLTNIVI